MASEKLSFGALFKKVLSNKESVRKYLLFTLIFLALGFVSVYLNYTNYALLGTLILVILILPLIVTFTEYTALIESGAPFPHNIKGFTTLFRNTYRSGRLRVVLTWKVILGFLLYVIVATFIITAGFAIFIASFDQVLLGQLQPLIDTLLNADSPEVLNTIIDEIGALFFAYDLPYMIVNQIAITAGIIFIINKSIFKVYASVFIEHQPTTKFDTVMQTFFSDKETKQTMRKMHWIFNLIVILLYALLFGGSLTLIYYLKPNNMMVLQADLIGLLALVTALPFATRFNFYLYQAIIKPKREEVLRFTINELRGILQNTMLPEQSKMYISEVLKARQKELDELTGIFDNISDDPQESIEKHD